MREPKQILVPTDFSEASNEALAQAQTLAKAFKASVHVLHVIIDPHAQAWSIDATGIDLGNLLERWEAEAQRRLDQISVPDVEHECVTLVGQPYQQIIKYVKDRDIDLIVMGTHGRGAIEHMLLGSVAEKVVRTASCPVMTVRAAAAA